ncbi:MAG: hypothetical protein IKV16_02440, partial [Clostridia bacterium]|nr:hypothetical protein [Clostridia bacterium]
EVVSVDGKVFTTAGSALYAALANPSYTITVLDANGDAVVRDEVVATVDYSMATYITTMEGAGANVNIVKALYAFGKAIIAAQN